MRNFLLVLFSLALVPSLLVPRLRAQSASPPQKSESKESASQISLPKGTNATANDEEGNAMELKAEEQVALIFVQDTVQLESGLFDGCKAQIGRLCSLEELIKGVKGKDGETHGFSQNPQQDSNYRYKATISGESYQVAATPRRAGLRGFLFVGKSTSMLGKDYYNPNGPATAKDKELGGIVISGDTFRR